MDEEQRSLLMINGTGLTEQRKCKENARCKKVLIMIATFVIMVGLLSILVFTSAHNVAFMKNYHLPKVVTECGTVTGKEEIVRGKVAYSFKGLPYAKPPLGKFRWREPVRLSDDLKDCWNGVYAADSYGSQCVQMGDVGSEDCLFLNVFTPSLDRTANMPVFVWIHGGNLMFLNGSIPGYHPDSEFVTSMNVVGVSMNYRLNAFGFMTLEELWEPGVSYGNYGLMDQILALKWVQRNIKNFGGDPNLVTISGHSSGGTSILGLLASQMADGLFHRAISMSGSPKFEKSYLDAANDNKVFLDKTGCGVLQTAPERKTCLLNRSAVNITNSIPYEKYPSWLMSDLYGFPTKGVFIGALIVVDPIVVTKPPKDVKELCWDRAVSIPLLVGNMAQEIDGHEFHNKSYQACRKYLTDQLNPFSTNFSRTVLDELYANFEREPEYLCGTIMSDVRVNCPTNKLTTDLESSPCLKVHRYVGKERTDKPINLYGYPISQAFHGWDSIALFNFKMLPNSFAPSNNDLKFQQSLRENIKHFMVYGYMKKEGWNAGKTGVFNKEGNVDVLKENYHESQCEFWNNPVNGFASYAWIN